MSTVRGFVKSVEVGRGGLVTIALLHSGGIARYTVSDIDGDPERFNERLSKVAVARDAMNRAEPVEIESEKDDGELGGEVDRIARLSRDELAPPSGAEDVGGVVLAVSVRSVNDIAGDGESHDEASVTLLTLDGGIRRLRLDLQAPERAVAIEQLRMIRDAAASGKLLGFVVDSDRESGEDILTVRSDAAGGRGDQREHRTTSAFIESLGTIHDADAAGTLALVSATTSPELTGPGGAVDPAFFSPVALSLFVPRGSAVYALVEAGLRDNVGMRLEYLTIGGDQPPEDEGGADGGIVVDGIDVAVRPEERGGRTTALLLDAELLAPLSSASRPVWLQIDRKLLDVGPDGCVPGLPSSSLQPRSLRDLRIPYTARWIGAGCFNPGVYRIQLVSTPGSVVRVDDAEICLYDSSDGKNAVVGYACLKGHHTVVVEIPDYVCDTDFDLDVYRVR